MRDIRAEILGQLQAGPATRRKLLHGRSTAFVLTYRRLLKDGLIKEGMSTLARYPNSAPVWVYLPGQSIPSPKIHRPRLPDIRFLMQHLGWTRQEAVKAIYDCQDYDSLLRLLTWAEGQTSPHVVDRRRRGRPRKIVPESGRATAENRA